MDSGLFWSAPAKRRDRIETSTTGDTSGACRELGPRVPRALRRRRFPRAEDGG